MADNEAPSAGRARRAARPDFGAIFAEQAKVDHFIEKQRPGYTAEQLEAKQRREAAQAERRKKRAEAEAEAAAAAAAAEPVEAEPDSESEGEGEEHKIQQLLVGRKFLGKAFVLVKWEAFPHISNTWEEKKHLHPEAKEDFDRKLDLVRCDAPAATARPGSACQCAQRGACARRSRSRCRKSCRCRRTRRSRCSSGSGSCR